MRKDGSDVRVVNSMCMRVYVCVSVCALAHAHVVAYVHMCDSGCLFMPDVKRKMLDLLLCHSLLYSFHMASVTELNTFSKQQDPATLAFHTVLGLQTHVFIVIAVFKVSAGI